jgi:hypothetical protein
MKLSAFRNALRNHPHEALAFRFPDGSSVPAHAHVTEVGRTEKTFLDCGGTRRHLAVCSLQIWTADDFAHRLPAGKLEGILDQAGTLLGADDPDVQVECQRETLALYHVADVDVEGGSLVFQLEALHAACLAMDICLPDAGKGSSCCGSGAECCG